MGFLKFLSRDKKKEMNDLDLPPEPPPLEGLEEPIPDMDSMDVPDFDSMSKPEMPPLPESKDGNPMKDDVDSGLDMPDFDNFDSADASSSSVPQDLDEGMDEMEPQVQDELQAEIEQPIEPVQPRPGLFRPVQPIKNDWQERNRVFLWGSGENEYEKIVKQAEVNARRLNVRLKRPSVGQQFP